MGSLIEEDKNRKIFERDDNISSSIRTSKFNIENLLSNKNKALVLSSSEKRELARQLAREFDELKARGIITATNKKSFIANVAGISERTAQTHINFVNGKVHKIDINEMLEKIYRFDMFVSHLKLNDMSFIEGGDVLNALKDLDEKIKDKINGKV